MMAEWRAEMDALDVRLAMEAAKKKAEANAGSGAGGGAGGGNSGGAGGGNSSGGSGAGWVDRIVNLYIGNSVAYTVPTNANGQQNLEALAREVIRVLEQQKTQLGY